MAATRTGQEKRLAARLLRGAVGGILAGMVFAGVTMWFADSTGGTASMPLQMISTIVKGDKARGEPVLASIAPAAPAAARRGAWSTDG